jgi:hypothetical protein
MSFDFPANPPLGQIYVKDDIVYEWNGYAWVRGVGLSIIQPSDYVLKAGDTMIGFLSLHADPSANMHAATKQYVDYYKMPTIPAASEDGLALVTSGGVGVWGAPIDGGSY